MLKLFGLDYSEKPTEITKSQPKIKSINKVNS